MRDIYLDNCATTQVYPEVADLMVKLMREEYGNPSSMHRKGFEAEKRVKEAQKKIADTLKVSDKEIFFTSGGTESDNWALIGAARANKRRGNHLITTVFEHPAVLNTMHFLEEEGFRITYLPVDANGQVRLDKLEAALCDQTIIVSVMHTNNEIGTVQPLEEIAKIIKKKNPHTLFHVDAVQGYGKFVLRPKKMGIDMLSVSGHKIHGPKGVGFLYVNEKVRIKPLIYGGGQQKGMRSGTDNVPGICGMALAAEMTYQNRKEKMEHLFELRERFVAGIQTLEGTVVNGPLGREGAAHVVSVSFAGIDRSEALLHALEDQGIYVSSGSACASNKPAPSATLKAIGATKEQIQSTIRFSMSDMTTREEIDETIEVLGQILPMLRRFRRK